MSRYPKAIAAGWHPIASSAELGTKPLSRILMDRPIVLFRGANRVIALVDRCPHRNMPLSAGRVRDGEIECPYHGWRFGSDGFCTRTPGITSPARVSAEKLPVIERAGLIWTNLSKDVPIFPELAYPLGDTHFDSFWWPVGPSTARVIDAIENLLDPAHPHFLHPGIVRSSKHRRPVDVTIKVRADRAEASYVENARATALIPRLLEGKRMTGIGRFLPPTIGQLAFEGPSGPRFMLTVFFTPESQNSVRAFAHFATQKGWIPAFFKKVLLRAFHLPVLAQDRAALRLQAKTIERFGGPKFVLGPLDFLLPAIERLAEGETPPDSDRSLIVEL